MVKKIKLIRIISFSLLMLITFTTNAQHHRQWHNGNIHHFESHDRIVWRGGNWRHRNYHGRLGWWWVVGPTWYYYSKPIYPYPDPYTPPTIVNPTPAPQIQNWYYCESSKEYYPYVSSCSTEWKTIPITPVQK